MRTLGQVKRDIAYHTAIANADNLGDVLDNDGNVAYTADERRASSRRQLVKLIKERETFERLFGTPECLAEFGPHTDHRDCARLLRDMNAPPFNEAAQGSDADRNHSST